MGSSPAIKHHRGAGKLPLAVLRDIPIAAHHVQGDEGPVVGVLCDHGPARIEYPAHASAPEAKQHRHVVERMPLEPTQMAALV